MTPTEQGATVPRKVLGRRLRDMRERAGITLNDAAEAIRGSSSKLSRLETGQSPFRQRDVDDLLTCYGIREATERAAVLELLQKANRPRRDYGDAPTWLGTYLDLEDAAQLIRSYELQLVPGFLQTEEYARAVISRRRIGDPAWVEARVRLRMSRQELLNRADPPDLWVVLDEAVLRRPVGGREVMRGQIERLVQTAKTPNVTVQVLPFDVGLHSADGGSFTLLRFSEPELADAVYLERLTGGQLVDRREDVEAYAEAMTRMSVEATTPEQTIDRLTDLLGELS